MIRPMPKWEKKWHMRWKEVSQSYYEDRSLGVAMMVETPKLSEFEWGDSERLYSLIEPETASMTACRAVRLSEDLRENGPQESIEDAIPILDRQGAFAPEWWWDTEQELWQAWHARRSGAED